MLNFLKFKRGAFVPSVILVLILTLSSFLRLYGINWDDNHHLHPDERFLTMVVDGLKWPKTFGEYLDPAKSPLNPYNAGYTFFVYGTFPLTLVKAASQIITFDKFSYNNITLVGRLISALFDLGIVFLVFKIGRLIFDEITALTASFIYAMSVLPIQLSHFFAVDTFLVFFLVLSFYFLAKIILKSKSTDRIYSRALFLSIGLGASFGLGIASKITTVLFLPVIGLGLVPIFFRRRGFLTLVFCTLVFLLSSFILVRLSDPRIFKSASFFDPTPNPKFVSNLKELASSADPNSLFPPAVQWIKTKPIIFPLKNVILWGLGLPLGITSILAVFYSLGRTFLDLKKIIESRFKNLSSYFPNFIILLVLLWILYLFIYQGTQFVKAMRYIFPIYPFLAILTANFIQRVIHKKVKNNLLLVTCYLLLVIYPLAFIFIYSRPHSRVTASRWIYKNIPEGSTISCEHWDDCLPLGLDGKSFDFYNYKIETLSLFAPDTPQKWQEANSQLKKIDYIIMSSNRLWGSIPKVPDKYPLTSKFYEDLFSERLNFKKVAEITSYPTIPIFNIPLPDDSADESFTVYDHPKVLIYKKTNG